MLDIIMNFDMTFQNSTIICHDMKYIIKKKYKMGDKAKPMARKYDKHFLTKLNKTKQRELKPIMKKV